MTQKFFPYVIRDFWAERTAEYRALCEELNEPEVGNVRAAKGLVSEMMDSDEECRTNVACVTTGRRVNNK